MPKVKEYIDEIFPASSVRLRKPEPITYAELHADAFDDYLKLDPFQHTIWKKGNRRAYERQRLRSGDIVFVYRKKKFLPALITSWHEVWAEENNLSLLPSIGMMVIRPKEPKYAMWLAFFFKTHRHIISTWLQERLKPSELIQKFLALETETPPDDTILANYENYDKLLRVHYKSMIEMKALLEKSEKTPPTMF